MTVVLVVDSHTWAQQLPISAGRLVCMSCGLERPILRAMGPFQSCAARLRARGLPAIEAMPKVAA